jgi:hypothetical protein
MVRGQVRKSAYVGSGIGVLSRSGTGHVKDDLAGLVLAGLGVELGVDDGKSAEELVSDVGEDGGLTWGDAILGEKQKEASEKFVDGNGRAEFLEVGGEGGGGFGGFNLILGAPGVARTEAGVDVRGRQAATPAVGKAMCAASGVVEEAGFSSLLCHFSFL